MIDDAAHADETPYWTADPDTILQRVGSTAEGLTATESARRHREYGPNLIRAHAPLTRIRVLLNQLRNPLLLVLIFAAAASSLTGQWVDASIVLAIVLATVGIGYQREYSAQTAAERLQARIRSRARVLRDGSAVTIPFDQIVPGDVVLLSAGSLVPADGVILESTDFYVSEAVLTGESFPVEKRPGRAESRAGLRARSNCVFLGTNVRSGTARCLIVRTGLATEFGAIAHRLTLRPPATEFDRGIRRFGYFLTSAMFVIVFLVFIIHVVRGRPPIETLLFSIALAVGLSPELLPAILSVNLARGAQTMARHGVLVRRLNAIENLGSMDMLCTDKTGTLTEGVVQLEGAYDASGVRSTQVAKLAAWNAALETGLDNPLDDAILQGGAPDLGGVRKLAEVPFDFVRKRVSVIVETDGSIQLITKGAFHHVLEICTCAGDGTPLDLTARAALEERFESWGKQGIRVLAVALRRLEPSESYTRECERSLAFLGFLTFLDQPKHDASTAIANLAELGVSIKIITGDSKPVAQHVASLVGMPADRIVTGRELQDMNDEALWRVAEQTALFVEVDPTQKERIILSLKKMGHVVGFLGDGVNDAPAMHAADTSLSVVEAVDVAREAADFVLLERDLDVIRQGIVVGRSTFANTLKYVLTTMSANLGNDQHGRGLVVPAVSPADGWANPAQQLLVRRAGGRHCRRRRGSRAGRAAAPMEYAIHRGVHDRGRVVELGLRFSDLRCAARGLPSGRGSLQDGLVRRVPADRAGRGACGPHAPAVLQKPARDDPDGVNNGGHNHCVRRAVRSVRGALRVRAIADGARRHRCRHHRYVRRRHRARQAMVLQMVGCPSGLSGGSSRYAIGREPGGYVWHPCCLHGQQKHHGP